MKLCSVSVDVDGVDHYQAIHGLPQAGVVESGLCHSLAISRLLQWAREVEIPLTWFVIGRDTNKVDFVQLLKGALSQGHEIANHSLDHRYDLVRLSHEAQLHQVSSAVERIEGAFGVRPHGFRAPGYTVSDDLLAIIQRTEHVYDSSVFPCTPYYAAKAAVLLGQRLLGRRSMSILDSPRVLTAPTTPYHIGVPYSQRGRGLLEIPIQVLPGIRIPFIGTALSSAGPLLSEYAARILSGLRVVNLELHAIDFLTAGDGLHALGRYQPDLRLPLERKRSSFSAVVRTLRQAGFSFVTMLEAARQLEAAVFADNE